MKRDTYGIVEGDSGMVAYARDGIRRIVRDPKQFGSVMRTGYFKLERRLARRFSDVELRQLRSLERAYSRRGGGPEVLAFGDSTMFWTTSKDQDRRRIMDLIQAEFDAEVGFEWVLGSCYNPRIITVYLSALARCSSQPRVVVVPTPVLMANTIWLSHPILGWELVAAELQAAVDANGRRPKRLKHPGDEEENAFDRLVSPSVVGPPRPVGELRLITNAEPFTPAQREVRMRHLLDYYNAERLEPDSFGVELVAGLGRTLRSMGLSSVAYIWPVNHEAIARTLGDEAREHVIRNAEVVETAYRGAVGDRGSVVNAICDSPAREFVDPIHQTLEGRQKLARRIAEEVRPFLAANGGTTAELAGTAPQLS